MKKEEIAVAVKSDQPKEASADISLDKSARETSVKQPLSTRLLQSFWAGGSEQLAGLNHEIYSIPFKQLSERIFLLF